MFGLSALLKDVDGRVKPGRGDLFVVRGKGHHLSPATKLGRCVKAAARSRASPTRRTVASSKARPITWRPSGSPSSESPAGTEIAGNPARLAGTVKTSLRYIATGSSL